MQLSTPVALPAAPFQLDPDRHVLTLGSCFAQHIGQHIADAFTEGKADAALIATMVHSGNYTIARIKRELDTQHIPVRL